VFANSVVVDELRVCCLWEEARGLTVRKLMGGRMTRREIRQTGGLGKETGGVTVNLPRHTQSM
jgi:hypothetical protein